MSNTTDTQPDHEGHSDEAQEAFEQRNRLFEARCARIAAESMPEDDTPITRDELNEAAELLEQARDYIEALQDALAFISMEGAKERERGNTYRARAVALLEQVDVWREVAKDMWELHIDMMHGANTVLEQAEQDADASAKTMAEYVERAQSQKAEVLEWLKAECVYLSLPAINRLSEIFKIEVKL